LPDAQGAGERDGDAPPTGIQAAPSQWVVALRPGLEESFTGQVKRPAVEAGRAGADPQPLDEGLGPEVSVNVGRTAFAHAVSLVKRFSDALQ
jgi:hypothetical protein